MIQVSRLRRQPRPGHWSDAKAVTFIVTLAASRSVTLAARAAGMSRKAAYALRGRDAAFADAWRQALAARAGRRQGNEVEEVKDPPVSPVQGNSLRIRDRSQDNRLRGRAFHATRGGLADRMVKGEALLEPAPTSTYS